MSFKFTNVDFSEFSKETSNRCDFGFISFNQKEKEETYSFQNFFDIKTVEKSKRLALVEALEDEDAFLYAEIGNVGKDGNVEPAVLSFSTRNELVEDYFKKIEKGDIQKADFGAILLSKVRPNLKKFVYIDAQNENFFYTTAFINLVPKKLGKILYYCFRNIFFKDLMAVSRQGKGYPTLKEDDLSTLRMDKAKIDPLQKNEPEILRKIEAIEIKIKDLRSRIEKPSDIINKVFTREFKFNITELQKQQNIKIHDMDFSSFADNIDLRQSPKFHRKAGQFVMNELRAITTKKIKDFLAEPIILGKSVSPSDFEDPGNHYYISMADIKNWSFDKESANMVSDEYSSNNMAKTVRRNDIIIARSGEGTIGKVAIIEEDINAIFADFTMRIRLKGCAPLFAFYYFRTIYFQYLVEIHKKGLGNNTNIFPSQIQEFPIPDIPLTRQQSIIIEIKKNLEIQDGIKKEIEDETKKIELFIESFIS